MSAARVAARSLVGFVAVALVSTACSGGSGGGSAAAGGVYKIGVITNSGGAFAANYKTMADGAAYAVKVINAAGGVNGNKVELETVDLQNNPANAVTLVPKLLADGVFAITGSVASADCAIACATANKLKVPLIAEGAAAPGVLKDSRPYGFAMAAVDVSNSTPVLTKIMSDLSVKTGAIITDQATKTTQVQAQIYQDVFKATNVNVVKTATFSTGDSSFAAQVTAIAAAKPQVLGLAAGPEDAGRIAREVQSQGLKVTLLGTGSLQSGGAAYFAAGGSAVEGTLSAAQYDPDSQNPIAAKLLAQCRTDTGQSDIPLNYAYAYDAIHMITTSIAKSNLTPASKIDAARVTLQEDLNHLGTFTGMAAETAFKPDGTSIRPQLRAIFKGNAFVVDHTSK